MRTTVLLSLVAAASPALLAQQTPAPAFEVATLKISNSLGPESGDFEHGRLTLRNAPIRHLVGAAYDMRVDLVVGGPGWIDTDRYDVEGKADAGTTEATWRLMLKTLLEERVGLRAHRESRLTPVLVLTVDKNGPRLQKSDANSPQRPGCILAGPLDCHKRTMADLAETLLHYATGIDLPVVDETGLTERYDFKLLFRPGAASAGTDAPAPDASIFDALRQLGLRLKPAKRPIGFLVIDGVNRVPSPN